MIWTGLNLVLLHWLPGQVVARHGGLVMFYSGSTTAVQNNKRISESADTGHLDANENVFLGLQCIVK